MTRLQPGVRLGILGGGQLARMLAMRAQSLGIHPHVLSNHASDPAAQVVRDWHSGSAENRKDLRRFLKAVDLATFESEFLDAELLQSVALDCQVPVLPKPNTMARLQDRATQKALCNLHRIPNARHFVVQTLAQCEQARTALGGAMVLKKRRFGYDGQGTFLIHSTEDLESLLGELENSEHGFIAEEKINFKREVAVMVARSRSGVLQYFPWVESHQEHAKCLWTMGPIHLTQGKRMQNLLGRFLQKINYVGIMGFEFFDTSQGLLLNELAPRVHNSAHYSWDALNEDQFTTHIKAILDWPFSPLRSNGAGFAMYNLLGSSDQPPKFTLQPGTCLHWYGKSDNRPGRKMGHITTLADSPQAALKTAKAARNKFIL